MMKIFRLSINAILFLFASSSFAQLSQQFDLHKLAKDSGLTVYNRDLTLINEDGHAGISLSKDLGEGIAWLKGVEFSNGTIEFDVRGENIKQHSFVGLAFHAKDNDTFDAIYLRPFQFMEDEPLKSHSIQYISLPDYTWQVLRKNSPGKYEHSIEPTPDPNSWIKMRIVVKDSTITTYINGSNEPSLVVQKVTKLKTGGVGFYVADTSGGDFANITITKAD